MYNGFVASFSHISVTPGRGDVGVGVERRKKRFLFPTVMIMTMKTIKFIALNNVHNERETPRINDESTNGVVDRSTVEFTSFVRG